MKLFKYAIPLVFLFIVLQKGNLWAQNPTIITNDVSGASACAGATVSVSFVASNLLNPARRSFVVQLSNIGGTFANPTALATGTRSPIVVTLPLGSIGGDYRVRVIADTVGVTYTPSSVFMVLKRPTAALTGDTTINIGGVATLPIFFSGNGPWTYLFTNANTGTTASNPLRGTVQPTVSTSYTLQSVSNICGMGTVSGSAKVTVIPRINTDFVPTSVCAGATASVPFSLTGSFETTGISYTVQLSNTVGSFASSIAIGSGTGSPISVVFPNNLTPSIGYRVRVVASANATSTLSNAFIIRPLPTAVLSGNNTITVGESANLSIALTGDAPWTVKLSNDQTITVPATPATVSVTPTVTTTYTLQSVSNTCGGAGTVSGSATVTVIPRISVAGVVLGSVCVGTNISLPFVVTGGFSIPVSYTAQLSDAAGSFVSPRNLAVGSASPIAITIPIDLPASAAYRLRVIASTTSTPIVSPAFSVKLRPTAVLSGNPTINFGDNAPLTVSFTGEGPWTFGLSDGTTATADRTPFVVNVKPSQTSTYLLNSVRNPCGEGTTSGNASVTVIPRLITENPTTAICAGKEIEVKFTIGGVIAANTVFQAQLSDSLGNFSNPFIIGTANRSPIFATVPTTVPPGSLYRLRVVVVGNPTFTSIFSSSFFLGRKPSATLSGGGGFAINPGDEIFLVLQFTGDAPWSYVLSDNSTGNTSTTPLILVVTPLLPTTYTLKSVSNTCGQGTVSGSAVANVIITSIEDLMEEKILVFPNPVSTKINLKISIPNATEWQLTDVQGRAWQSRLGLSGLIYEEAIDIQSLPAGTYIFRIKVGENWYNRKIVKH